MIRRDQTSAPSLVDLCVQKAIDNVRYLGNVGPDDHHLLERILLHCTLDQLMHVEKASKGTDKLWKKFFEKQFGIDRTNEVIETMSEKRVSFRWLQLYEANVKKMAQYEIKAVTKMKKLYEKEDASMQPMIDETSVVNNQHSPSLSSVDYLHAPSLPLDLVEEEILSRLPVKLLFQIRCVCKSWNSLISDPRFAKKHLVMSTTRRLYFLSSSENLDGNMITSCPLQCVYTTVSTNVTKLEYPPNNCDYSIVGSCNGILCVVHEYSNKSLIQLWNPSIRKVKELPPFEEPPYPPFRHTYGFGYDFVTDNYKVVVISFYRMPGDFTDYTELKVNTLGTNFWKNLQEFPFDSTPDCMASGIFVSGTINWLASKQWRESPCFIVSMDLGKESFQKILLPDYGDVDVSVLYLSVLRDCLCMMYGHDVWIMKEYGNKESWTKLFSVSYMRDPSKSYYLTKTVYMFEDGQVLLQSLGDWYSKLIVYDPKIGTFKFIKFQNNNIYDRTSPDGPEVCIESLISPC